MENEQETEQEQENEQEKKKVGFYLYDGTLFIEHEVHPGLIEKGGVVKFAGRVFRFDRESESYREILMAGLIFDVIE